ncbi:Putative fucosyltransferase-like protein [Linum perenne]
MGGLANIRNWRNPEDGLLISSPAPAGKRIAFLGRLDTAKNAVARVDSWADSLFDRSGSKGGAPVVEVRNDVVLRSPSCEEWLEREDAVDYSRDFDKVPILVAGGEKEWKVCPVKCQLGNVRGKTPDAIFEVLNNPSGTVSVHRSMESAQYYPQNGVTSARRRGHGVVMTTSLSSDVPVGYFSWAEYDIMAPVEPKTEKAFAAAFISNCGSLNFRLQVLNSLVKRKIPIDSYGACHRNRDGRVNKVKTLKRYKFSLAFENSNEEDYVTEKFFQSLVAGTIPVVVGAPNIQDFAPGPGSVLHIKTRKDVKTIAKTIRYLSENDTAYNQSIRWKFDGPSDSFKALVDMAAVHSSCRLCIHIATKIQDKEERRNPLFKKRPCRCTRGSETVHHLFVRERGGFKMESIFLNSGNLTLSALEDRVLDKFRSIKHVPNWKQERPKIIRGGDEDYRVYRVYPVGLTQRQALYSFRFTDFELKNHLEVNPCAKLEVVFV